MKNKYLVLWFVVLLSIASYCATPPYVIECNFDNTTPTQILNNLAYYESLPLDGNTIKTSVIWNVMSNNVVNYNSLYNELLPLKGKYTKLDHSWIFVGKYQPGDWFNNWSTVIQNFATVAKVCKDLGMEGMMFDPENTGYNTWEYGLQSLAGSKTEDQYRAQARVQGKAIMEACVKEFPAFKICFLHGPYISEPNTPPNVRRDQYGNYPAEYRLFGSFFVGFVQGKGADGMVIDGGETYQLRTATDFATSYDWRKFTIASAANNSPNIPLTDRATYPNKVSISFGLYPKTWPYPADEMTPTIMRTTAENALRKCDYLVWWYDAITADYMTALKGACDATKKGVGFISAKNVTVPSNGTFGYKIKYSNTTGFTATLSVTKKPAWVTYSLDTLYGTAPELPSIDTVFAIVTAGGKSDTLKLQITVAQYYSFEAENSTITNPMQVGTDVLASKGSYITTPVGAGKTITPKIEAVNSLNILQSGNYYAWALIYSVAGNTDVGVFTGFNGKFDKAGLKPSKVGAYEWVRSATPYTLLAGVNSFNLGHGNEQVKIDKIIITNSSDTYLPTGVPTSILTTKNSNLAPIISSNIDIKTVVSNNCISFNVSLKKYGDFTLKILDVFGKKLWEHNVIGANKGMHKILVQDKYFVKGICFAVLNQQEKQVVNKFVVLK